MTNLSFMMTFLLSLLLSFSCQSIIIEAREGKGCPPTPSPSMIDTKEGVNKCPPNPSPSMMDSEETVNKVCLDRNGQNTECHCKCPKHKTHTPSPSPSMMDLERANKQSTDHNGHRGKCPPSPSPSMIDFEGVLIKECMDNKGRINNCHCKCPKSKAPTPSFHE
ncbi:PREDICTED: uncharacterized protein LOC104777162 [Camelina sativa]|uniref:Uncharacterized protein LOC104777162 n=1 Tax=Camelina sativa TaxID=90675 RepID=A0ABM0YEC3_CAMSA|nr:PREDICTED: uncharacterized protein LOC104777162 [Camelina sativa]